ncbi:hypothetical protein CK203_089613 [Vitis vinifera]|uniref:RING-type E3 ubiquitin transferase n=1 Tax=Vitis vinifera TaxID=29760 RepID=A0A438EYV7_VITVI|nr:hypothetical protein CK203_089613 [Vitis vinifera]
MVMEIVVSLVLLFVGIAVLIVIHVCIVGRAFRRAYGNGAMVQRGGSGGLGMSQDELKKLPCFEYKAVALEKASNSPVDCAVCLENFRKGDKCRLLPNSEHNLIPESKLQTLAIHWDSGLLHLHLVGGIKVIGLRSDPRKYYSLEKYGRQFEFQQLGNSPGMEFSAD